MKGKHLTYTTTHPQSSFSLFQRLKDLGSSALVNALDQIKVPCLAVASSGLLDALHAGIVVSLGSWTGLDAVLAELGEMIDRFFVVRLFVMFPFRFKSKFQSIPQGLPSPYAISHWSVESRSFQ